MRLFAYGTAYNYNLQLTATTFNESAFRDMDYVLNEAAKRNLRVTIALSSNWVYGPNTTGTRLVLSHIVAYQQIAGTNVIVLSAWLAQFSNTPIFRTRGQ